MRVSNSPKRYSDEFRNDAMNLVRRGDRSFRQLGVDLGVSHWTLRDWWKREQVAGKGKKAKATGSSGAPVSESAEEKLARLERENRRLVRENEQLRMDREILKKAAAFFAKEGE